MSAGFPAPLNEGLIPQATLSNFATGSLNPCTVNGKVYCLRNDLSQVVLWYNASLMKQWGYQVPTTWPQYEQLGETVAKQHPGYLVGNAGDTFTPEIYMWASQCQANDVTGLRTVTVNVTSPDCTRMASLLDTLIKAGSMSKLSVFSTAFDKNEKGKVLMLPGPGVVRRSRLRLHVGTQRAEGSGSRRARSPVAGNVHAEHRQRRRRNMAAVRALART